MPVILLHPPHAWDLVADDDRSRIWVTRASSSDAERLEPIFDLPDSAPSAATAAKLAASDYYAFVVLDKVQNSATAECRPRSGDRLYVKCLRDSLCVFAGIDNVDDLELTPSTLSSRFTAIWLANSLKFGNFDHFLGCGPIEGLVLVARGVRSTFDFTTSKFHTSPYQYTLPRMPATGSLEEAIGQCRSALCDVISIATQAAEVVAECSGGIDSGLVSVLASRIAGSRFVGGAFADHPYHEFREEVRFARAVAESEGFALLGSDPKLMTPWGAQTNGYACPSNEPSLMLPFWGQVLASYKFVKASMLPVVLSGFGGDLLFQTSDHKFDLCGRPSWTEASLWSDVIEELGAIDAWLSSADHSPDGYGFDNPWMSRALSAIHPGALYYAPLASRSVISSICDLRAHLDSNRPTGHLAAQAVQKSIAFVAFGDLLPAVVWSRRWKIDFVGNHYRVWLRSGSSFVELLKRMSPFMEAVGIRPSVVCDLATRMAKGMHSSDRMLNSLLTYIYWIDKFCCIRDDLP